MNNEIAIPLLPLSEKLQLRQGRREGSVSSNTSEYVIGLLMVL